MPLVVLANRIRRTQSVNMALGTHLTPDQVDDLPADMVEVAIQLVAPPKKRAQKKD